MSNNCMSCTGCKRCETICPENTPISELMHLLKEYEETNDFEKIKETYQRDFRRRTGCVNCGRCLSYCPEKITIPYYILSVKEDFA